MPALHALGQALDVQRSTAQGISAPSRPASPPATAPITDRVTLSPAARELAAGCGPCEGEPTDLEGALGSRPVSGTTDPVQALPEPTAIDLFA